MPIQGITFLRSLKTSSLQSVYYLYGEEDFLIEECVKRVVEDVIPPSVREFNLQTFYSKETEPSNIIDSAKTLPAFSPKRVVIVKDVDYFSASQLDLFVSYIEEPVDTTILLLLGSKPDFRRRFYNFIEARNVVVEFSTLRGKAVFSWVKKEVEGMGGAIADNAVELLIETTGERLRPLHNEIVKLTTYANGKKIDDEDVAALSPSIRLVSIFDFIDALSRGDRYKAFKLLKKLIEEGEAPPVILSLIARHFRILWMLKVFERKGYPLNEIKKRFSSIPERFLKGYLEQSRGFKEATLRDVYKRIFHADIEIKRGPTPSKDVVENITLDLLFLFSKG